MLDVFNILKFTYSKQCISILGHIYYTLQGICTALGYSPEFYSKMLFLKMPRAWIIKHGESKGLTTDLEALFLWEGFHTAEKGYVC